MYRDAASEAICRSSRWIEYQNSRFGGCFRQSPWLSPDSWTLPVTLMELMSCSSELAADTLLADKGYDADERVLERLQQQGKTAVIPPKCNRTVKREYDRDLYKARHLIENFFAQLKQYRAIATRYDKLARNFLSAIYLAAAVIWLN